MRFRRFAPAAAFLCAPLLIASVASLQTAPKADAPQVPYPQLSQRGATRIFWWNGNTSAGEVAVDYGRPAWKDEYDAAIEKNLSTRWRLGQDFWTSLDTSIDLVFGKTEVAPGQWYLALERKADGSFVLIFLDATEIRDHHLDAYQVASSTGGIEIPIEHKVGAVRCDHLAMRLENDGSRKNGGKFVIQFGMHELTARFEMKPAT